TFIIILLLPWVFNPSSQDSCTLTGQWTLICYENLETNERSCRPSEYLPSQLTFGFKDDGQSGKIQGMTTVNRVTGDYRIDKNHIVVEKFGGTKIAEHGWGSDFWTRIRNSGSYEFRKDTLVIFNTNDTRGMLFVPAGVKKSIE
ncbi:MAG: META domain-containing protein, partial [Bacteroidales bacterium]|nr:META domain-containing protein [Bacteroidales bacterium]